MQTSIKRILNFENSVLYTKISLENLPEKETLRRKFSSLIFYIFVDRSVKM